MNRPTVKFPLCLSTLAIDYEDDYFCPRQGTQIKYKKKKNETKGAKSVL